MMVDRISVSSRMSYSAHGLNSSTHGYANELLPERSNNSNMRTVSSDADANDQRTRSTSTTTSSYAFVPGGPSRRLRTDTEHSRLSRYISSWRGSYAVTQALGSGGTSVRAPVVTYLVRSSFWVGFLALATLCATLPIYINGGNGGTFYQCGDDLSKYTTIAYLDDNELEIWAAWVVVAYGVAIFLLLRSFLPEMVHDSSLFSLGYGGGLVDTTKVTATLVT